jgi:porin
VVCLLVAAGPYSAVASDFSGVDYLTGNWDGKRDVLKQRGIDGRLQYTTEPMFNVSGGEKRGGTYTHNIGFDLMLDLDRMLSGGNTTFLLKVSQRSGDSVSEEYVAPSEGGNTFTVQEIYGGQTLKLANVQFNSLLLDDRLDIAYGRLVANDDFLRSPLYCQFVNNSFCGSPKPVFLHDPFTFSAYPTAQWGGRGRYDTASGTWALQGAVYDGDPEDKNGNPADSGNNEHGTNWDMGGNGAVLVAELHYHLNRGSGTRLPGVYKIGGYYMSGDFKDISRADNGMVEGNAMVWLLADQRLYREHPGIEKGLSWFGSLVFSLEDKVNLMDHYFNTGLLYEGLFVSRPRDVTGLSFTAGWFSDELNKARQNEGKTPKDYEAAIEFNHRFDLGRGISITPDVQYIIRPAGTDDIDNALLTGAKLAIRF